VGQSIHRVVVIVGAVIYMYEGHQYN